MVYSELPIMQLPSKGINVIIPHHFTVVRAENRVVSELLKLGYLPNPY